MKINEALAIASAIQDTLQSLDGYWQLDTSDTTTAGHVIPTLRTPLNGEVCDFENQLDVDFLRALDASELPTAIKVLQKITDEGDEIAAVQLVLNNVGHRVRVRRKLSKVKTARELKDFDIDDIGDYVLDATTSLIGLSEYNFFFSVAIKNIFDGDTVKALIQIGHDTSSKNDGTSPAGNQSHDSSSKSWRDKPPLL